MPRYALLLRGVNVGGHGKLPMAELRALLEGLGQTDVVTYLQSGNAVVTTPLRTAARLAAQVQRALADQRGLATSVLVRTEQEIGAVIAGNPYPRAAADNPKLLHAVFLADQPTPAAVAALTAQVYDPDECRLGPSVLYLKFAKNVHESRMATDAGKRLGVPLTARNWSTVLALQKLLRTKSRGKKPGQKAERYAYAGPR